MPSAKGKRGGNATANKPKRSSMPRKSAASGGGKKKVSKGASFADTGANLGSRVGGMLGRMGAGLISRITGFGSYEVSKNTISNGNAVASFYNDGDGVVVCHREYLSDLSGSTAFTLGTMSVNPGLPGSFPWLSQIANQFEEYEMMGLVYEFRPLSGMAVSTTSASLGAVIFATDYNPYNPSFPNKQSMESYEFATSTVPFNQMLHPVECKPGSAVLTRKFVRSGAVTDGTLQLYDLGNFEYATQGMQSSYVVGELWVSYHVRLSKPRLDLTTASGSARFVSTPPQTATSVQIQGTTGLVTSYSTIPTVTVVTTTAANGRGITVGGVGFYQIVIAFTNASVTAGSGTAINPGANIVLGPAVFPGSIANPNPSSGYGSGSGVYGVSVYYFQVKENGTGPDNFLNINNVGGNASTTNIMLYALPYPPPF